MTEDKRWTWRWPAGLAAAIGALVAVLAVSGSAAAKPAPAPTVRAAGGAGGVPTLVAPLTTPFPVVSLYNQNNDDAGDGYTSTSNYGAQAADDFIVPAGHAWTVTSVATTGADYADLSSVTVTVYLNAAGSPGTPVYTVTVPSGSFTDAPGMFGYPGGDLTVPIDATLGPGHYWLSVQGDGTNYFWWIRKPIANDPAQWRDPTDFFGLGCPAWTDMATCFSYTGDGAPGTLDLMFSVSGTSSTDKQVGAASVCNGSYNGFGTNVVVPAGATCTILPGGGVAYDLKVMKGGTLNMDGASIGHDLTVDGSATVCDSEVGHDLTADGGPLTIGGPTCIGNDIGEDLTVQNVKGGATVEANTVVHNLNVLNDQGGVAVTDNSVGQDMSVQHDGSPTTVSDNTVGHNAICKNNKGQTGSSNSAGGSDTCPH